MVWHAAHVSPLHSVNKSEGTKHTSSMSGTQSTVRSQIPGQSREGKGASYLTEWRLSFSFPGAGLCQRELWILNFEGSSSIYYFQIWKAKQEEKCRMPSGKEKSTSLKTSLWPGDICMSNGKQWKWAKCMVSQKEKLYRHPAYFSHKLCFLLPKEMGDKNRDC